MLFIEIARSIRFAKHFNFHLEMSANRFDIPVLLALVTLLSELQPL